MTLPLDDPLKQKDKERMNYARVIVVRRKGNKQKYKRR